MNRIHRKKKASFLSIALGSLIVTSLGTGSTNALPFSCTLKCTKSSVSKDVTRLNDCASKCDNTKIIDILVPNAENLNADNQKHYQTALKYQQSIIEKQLKAETSKKKQSKSKINDLNEKQDKLIAEINRLENLGNKPEEASKAPERPKSGPRPSRPTSQAQSGKASSQPQVGSHRNKPDVNQPPSDMPPSYVPNHSDMPPPEDMPPTLDEHQAATKSHEKPSNQPKQPLTLLEQIQAAKDLKLKKVQTKESPNVGAGKVIGTDQPTTETAEHALAPQSGGSSQPKQPLTLLEQIQAGKKLNKVDQNAPKSPNPEKNLQQQLEEAMTARRGSMNAGEKKSKVLTPEEQAEKEKRKAEKQAEWDEGQ
ncbi:MAG: WH2 domain-containing protein [Candidatus Paracaedibacter sp.]